MLEKFHFFYIIYLKITKIKTNYFKICVKIIKRFLEPQKKKLLKEK